MKMLNAGSLPEHWYVNVLLKQLRLASESEDEHTSEQKAAFRKTEALSMQQRFMFDPTAEDSNLASRIFTLELLYDYSLIN